MPPETPSLASTSTDLPAPAAPRANARRARLLEMAAALLRIADELGDIRLLGPQPQDWEYPEEPPAEVVLAGSLDEAMYHKLPEASSLLVQARQAIPDDPIKP
jgi:hypothetical protein